MCLQVMTFDHIGSKLAWSDGKTVCSLVSILCVHAMCGPSSFAVFACCNFSITIFFIIQSLARQIRDGWRSPHTHRRMLDILEQRVCKLSVSPSVRPVGSPVSPCWVLQLSPFTVLRPFLFSVVCSSPFPVPYYLMFLLRMFEQCRLASTRLRQ